MKKLNQPKFSQVQLIAGLFFTVGFFLLFPNTVAAEISAPTKNPPQDGSTLYTYDTFCQSKALRKQQAFIIPNELGTVDNLYLHLHGSENPEASALCTFNPGQGLCAAATVLKDNNIRETPKNTQFQQL